MQYAFLSQQLSGINSQNGFALCWLSFVQVVCLHLIGLFVCLFVCLSACLPACLLACLLAVFLPGCLPACTLACLFVGLSVGLSVCYTIIKLFCAHSPLSSAQFHVHDVDLMGGIVCDADGLDEFVVLDVKTQRRLQAEKTHEPVCGAVVRPLVRGLDDVAPQLFAMQYWRRYLFVPVAAHLRVPEPDKELVHRHPNAGALTAAHVLPEQLGRKEEAVLTIHILRTEDLELVVVPQLISHWKWTRLMYK